VLRADAGLAAVDELRKVREVLVHNLREPAKPGVVGLASRALGLGDLPVPPLA
jgi:hypothetical protein